jgi:glycosyltransferase involved in cell wall biosynthesis
MPFQVLLHKIDIMHYPAFPPGLFSKKPYVFTVHDANIWEFPETLSWKGKLYFKPLSLLAVKGASKIITVSQSSASSIAERIGAPKRKIIITGEGISNEFRIINNQAKIEHTRKKYRLPEKFILFVGSIEPRKNIIRLINAFAKIKRMNGSIPHKLLLVGRKAWGKKAIEQEISKIGLENDIVLLGYVSLSDLVAIYNLSDLFVFPSLYEGFGLPPLEALACGVPVAASNAPAIPEILDNAAVYFDPFSIKDMSIKIRLALLNTQLRKEMIRRGLERVRLYSWENIAINTSNAYKLALKSYFDRN